MTRPEATVPVLPLERSGDKPVVQEPGSLPVVFREPVEEAGDARVEDVGAAAGSSCWGGYGSSPS
jgi:hypothetical protein